MANVLACLSNVLRVLANHSEIQDQAYPQVFHDIDQSVVTIFTTDLTDWTDLCPVSAGSKTKTRKTPWRGWRAMPLLLYFRLGLIRASS